MKKLLLLLVVVTSAAGAFADRVQRVPLKTKEAVAESSRKVVEEQQMKRNEALASVRRQVANMAAKQDPAMEARRAMAQRRATALDEQSYRLRLDSIVTPGQQKRVITSDVQRNRWIHEDVYVWQFEEWQLNEKIDYSYDKGGVTATTYYQSEGADPVATRVTTNYDARDNQTLYICEQLPQGSTEWVGSEKTIATYFDGSFDMAAEMREMPLTYETYVGGENPGEWALMMRYVTKYDELGRNIYYEYVMESGNGLQGSLQDVEVGDDGIITSSTYEMRNGEWAMTYKATGYSDNMPLSMLRLTLDDNGATVKSVLTEYEYLDGSLVNEYIKEKTGDEDWHYSSKTIYVRDDKGHVQKWQGWTYDENKKDLALTYEIVYTNDKDGHHESGAEGWIDDETGKWRDVYTYTYKYDGDLMTEEVCFDVEEDKFVEKVVYIYTAQADYREVRIEHYLYSANANAFEDRIFRSETRGYDGQGNNVLEDIIQQYGQSRSRVVSSYSATGKYETRCSENWENDVQTYGRKKVFEVDDKERELTCTITVYDTTAKEWTIDSWTEKGYDAEGYVNHYRSYSVKNGVRIPDESFDIVVSTANGLTTTARITYWLDYPDWIPSTRSDVVKNEWNETVTTESSDYDYDTKMWFVNDNETYHFNNQYYGCTILGGGKNHYMVTDCTHFNSDGQTMATYYYSETVNKVETGQEEPVAVALDMDKFWVEIEIRNPEQPEAIPVATPDFEAVIIEQETQAVVAIAVPFPSEYVPEQENPECLSICFEVQNYFDFEEVKGEMNAPLKVAALSDKYELIIKAGSVSFNQMVYQYDILMPVEIEETLLTDVKSLTLNAVPTSRVYDLQGRRVTLQTKGIYIKDGKKVLK